MAAAFAAATVPFLALSPSVDAGTLPPAVSSVKNTGGFPTWYQDSNGVRVEPCLDPNDANCLAPLPNPGIYDPTLPLSFPTNYPDESFYASASSLPVATTDCGAGTAQSQLALEAAYLNGAPVQGDQMVFGRIRIIVRGGLCAGQWYTFRTPYGPVTLQADVDGGIKPSPGTTDVGCLPGPLAPCDFRAALGSELMTNGLLMFDPANAAAGKPVAVPGYLGATETDYAPVVGGKNGFNQFEIVRWNSGAPTSSGLGVDCTLDCSTMVATPDFSVSAKIAGPLAGSVASLDFGGVEVGTTSASRSVTLTNLGAGALGLDPAIIDHVAITGAGAAQFALATTTCSIAAVTAPAAATEMARDAACDLAVTYSPSALGATTASLEVFVTGHATPFTLPLVGSGITVVHAPVISVTPAGGVDLGAVRKLTAGAVHNLTVSNTGDAPLLAVASLPVGVTGFEIATDNCSAAFVPAGGSCTLGLRFVPTAVGAFTSALSIQTNTVDGTLSIPLSATATGGTAAVSATNNPVNTFPDWYQDERGVRLGQCDDVTNPLCITAPIVGTQSFPTNYPDEWFYYIASSDRVPVLDCDSAGGNAFVEAGTEAAFLGPIVPNGGITFGRLRIVVSGGLCADTPYLFTHPYGQSIITSDVDGQIKPAAGTTDVGCVGAPCDYTQALASVVSEGYLEQTVRPAGYLGDPAAPSQVTGAPYIDPATGQPFNKFRVQKLNADGTPGEILAETDLFAVSGRLVGPMVVSPATQDFGTAAVDGGIVTQEFTFTNEGIAPVDATSVAISGPAAADYTVDAATDTCTPVAPATVTTLAIGASCTVSVTFDPTATGVRSAALVLNHSGRNNPLQATLTGVGAAAAGSPAISTPLATITFPDLQVGQVSASADIVVSNIGGQAPLIVGTTPRGGTNPAQFLVTNECPGNNVARPGTTAPGATCVVKVRFAPTAAGAKVATVTINSNAGPITVNLTGRGSLDVPAQSATTSVAGFPSWYQDGNGVRLEQCLANDGNCVLLADASFNPAQPVVWPTNYPMESFYSFAESELLPFGPDASCGAVGGFAIFRVATEATFTTPTPQAGGQTLFNRIRVTANGLCPNTTYTFVQPYGQLQLTTDGNGAIRANAGTIDTPNVTGSAPITPGVLQWDPNVAPAAPAGYLGDGRTPHKVVGSQFRIDLAGEPVNFFRIDGPNGTVAQTDKFLVSGRLAGPVVSSLDSKDFGVVEMGRLSTAQVFTITNIGSASVTNLVTSLTGADAALFTITANTCATAGLVRAQDQSCAITVRFAPTVAGLVGVKNAVLTVGHSGLRSPISIPLTGTANAVQTPALTVTPATMAFGTITAGVTSATQTLTIRNSGTGAMRLGALTLSGLNPGEYRLVATSSATVCPINGTLPTANLTAGASCTVTVAFAPSSIGAKTGTISVSATDRVTADGHVTVIIPNANVALSGTGAQGTIRLSATTLNISARTGASTTSRITLTNGGTAPFSLVGAPALFFEAVSTNTPLPKFTVTSTGCNNVAVARSCTVSVTFTPGAGTVNEVFRVRLGIRSNASNSLVYVAVNGTRAR